MDDGDEALIDARSVQVGAPERRPALPDIQVRPVDVRAVDSHPARTGGAVYEAVVDTRAIQIGAPDRRSPPARARFPPIDVGAVDRHPPHGWFRPRIKLELTPVPSGWRARSC